MTLPVRRKPPTMPKVAAPPKTAAYLDPARLQAKKATAGKAAYLQQIRAASRGKAPDMPSKAKTKPTAAMQRSKPAAALQRRGA